MLLDKDDKEDRDFELDEEELLLVDELFEEDEELASSNTKLCANSI